MGRSAERSGITLESVGIIRECGRRHALDDRETKEIGIRPIKITKDNQAIKNACLEF